MKKYFLFLNLFLMLVVVSGTETTLAEKKYRYIKREHGVRFEGDIPMEIGGGQMIADLKLKGAYAYNWKGLFEFGPYFLWVPSIKPWSPGLWGLGLLAEYNIIKNRGKRQFIPAVGLNLGATGGSSDTIREINNPGTVTGTVRLSMGLYGALKIFVGKRTPFTITLAYNLLTPLSSPFAGGVMSHNVDLSMGFSYYFDFY